MKKFTEGECWLWHAYDYGWRRVFLGAREPHSPVDQQGEWFDPLLADQTEAYFSARHGFSKPEPRDPGTYEERCAAVEAIFAKHGFERDSDGFAVWKGNGTADPDQYPRQDWAEAAEYRDRWAQERGCVDFSHAMEVGLVSVAKRAPGAPFTPPERSAPAREITPKVWEERAKAYDPPPDDPALIAAALKALER